MDMFVDLEAETHTFNSVRRIKYFMYLFQKDLLMQLEVLFEMQAVVLFVLSQWNTTDVVEDTSNVMYIVIHTHP